MLFSINIFLSAFLLFQIQPLIGKSILPWFGGTPAVWSTLLLFFQVLLTGGYAYAAWSIRQGIFAARLHIFLVAVAILSMGMRGSLGLSPVMPPMPAASQSIPMPIPEIVRILSLSIGLPFFVLSSNGPLMQAWFSQVYPYRSYASLYAFSNFGSLLGLITYPFWVEPNLSLRYQGWIWSLGFLVFGLLTGWLARLGGRVAHPLRNKPTHEAASRMRLTPALLLLWILLSATASLSLLSVTNQLSQEVAVIPFLWILPLAIYLTSFILTFSGEHGYQPKLISFLFLLSFGLMVFVMLNATRLHFYWQIVAYCLLLFAICMLCHGELYLLRPTAEHLTQFYLMVSIGGALGGIFVSLIAPILFNGYWEFFVGLSMTMAILLTVLRRAGQATARQTYKSRARFIGIVFLLVTSMLGVLSTYFSGSLYAERNFYGLIRVRKLIPTGANSPAYVMSHGITVHGLQFIDPALRDMPTTYYVPKSGAGVAILNHPRYGRGLRVGILGGGMGTLTAYGQAGDVYRQYEINPAIVRLAEGQGGYFSFVNDSQADITTILGDARVSLQRELDQGVSQNFDVLVLDTFSSDSIPVHLVTKEAFALYLEHLAADGIIAAHITNLHLDLEPVFWQLAQAHGLSMARVDTEEDAMGGYASHWILLAREPALLEIPAIQERSVDLDGYSTHVRLWTDDYSNLFQILKW